MIVLPMNPASVLHTPAEVTVCVHRGTKFNGVRFSRHTRVEVSREFAKQLLARNHASELDETYVLSDNPEPQIWATGELFKFRVIDARLDLAKHSPTGYGWGYAGSGPAQAALAIVADALRGDDARALRVYQLFKVEVLAGLPKAGGLLSRADVLAAIDRLDPPVAA